MTSAKIYQFDGITVDVAAMRICRGTADLVLEAKTFRLLQFLIENRERVLSKEEIFQAVWQGTAVSDNALTRAIAQIRKVLEDDPRKPRYIDTVTTVGYRFIGVLGDGHVQAPIPARKLRLSGWWAVVVIVVVTAAGLVFWRIRPRLALLAMFHPIPLTTYPGTEFAPSFSPDGDQVAFVWDGEKQDNYDIYVKTLGSDATPLRLTTDAAPDLWPVWSPDGRTIAFERYVGEMVQLMLIPALGGPERKLCEFHRWLDRSSFLPDWSPDSEWLIVPITTGSSAVLSRVSVETGEATPIIQAQEALADLKPALSPDGKTLLYIRIAPFSSGGDLWSVRVDKNMRAIDLPRRVPMGGAKILQSQWTADGKGIIAVTLGGFIRLPAGGSNSPQPIPLPDRYVGLFAVSRQNNRLAYSTMRGDANIWRVDLSVKATHPERLIASTLRDVYPRYSPDGRKLAFYTNRTGGGNQIWLADADGRNQQQLTFVKFGSTATPNWSPDGRAIAFDLLSFGKYRIYTIGADGGKITPLTRGPNDFGATWSRDERWVYYNSSATGQNELWKIPVGGGAAIQMTHNGGTIMMGIESLDGKTLYFSSGTNPGSIWKMPSEGGPAEKLIDSLYRTNFAVNARGIYYMTIPGADLTSALMFYSFATRTSSLVTAIGVPEYGLDVSPDGRYLAYAELDNPASELMLIENFH